MNELDKKIRAALSKEDADALDDLGGEPSMFAMVVEAFRGRHRWLMWLTMFWSLVFFALSVVSAIQFFKTEDPRDMQLWGLGFFLCIAAVSMFKIWFWMELVKNAIMREIKRLELQVARLSGRIKD